MKKILAIVILTGGLIGCQPENKVPTFTVKGKFTNTGADKIFLAELPFGSQQRTVVDTANLNAQGDFELSTPSKGEGIYQVFVEKGPGLMLINDVDKLEIKADANHLAQYSVNGGKANTDLKNLYAGFLLADSNFQVKRAIADSLYQKKNADSAFNVARQQTDAAIGDVQKLLTNFIQTEANGSAVYFALGISKAYSTGEQWNGLLESSLKKFPQHPGIALLKLPAPQEDPSVKQGTSMINQPVTNISLPDTSGKIVSINDFRGKWLLVDFWASWCGPCRGENPNVVAAYKQFKNQNFTVLGISLDQKKEPWLKAIQDDGLSWTHISDLKYWDSKAVATFGINSIPFNMLVNPEGKVVDTDLRGEELATTLAKYVR